MAFKIKNQNGYSEQFATEALGSETLHIVGLELETQYEYENNARTNTISGYQAWIATASHNPFRVKFLPENKPDLTFFSIGDEVSFEKLEAIQIKNNVYFRAKSIQKAQRSSYA